MHRLLVAGAIWLAALVWSGTAGAWSWPADGAMLRPFSLGPNPYAPGQHRGIDVAGTEGSIVRAPASGVVTFAGSVPTNGRGITILTPDGYAVTLFHLGAISVAKGDSVAEGAAVGTMGWSGEPEHPVPTAHLGIRLASQDDGYVDPLGLLPPLVVPVPAAPPPPTPATPAAGSPATPAATPPQAGAAVPTAATAAASSAAEAPSMPAPAVSPGSSAQGPAATQPAAPTTSDAPQSASSTEVSSSSAVDAAGAAGAGDGLVIVASPARPVDEPVRPASANAAGQGWARAAVRLVPRDATGAGTGTVPAARSGDAASRDQPRLERARDDARARAASRARPPVATALASREGTRGQVVRAHDAHDGAPAARRAAVAAIRPPVIRAVPPESLVPLAAVAAAIAAIVLFATAVTRKAARRIGSDGAVLPHHTDLLRQLDAAHRPRLHDGGRGRLCTPSTAARP